MNTWTAAWNTESSDRLHAMFLVVIWSPIQTAFVNSMVSAAQPATSILTAASARRKTMNNRIMRTQGQWTELTREEVNHPEFGKPDPIYHHLDEYPPEVRERKAFMRGSRY